MFPVDRSRCRQFMVNANRRPDVAKVWCRGTSLTRAAAHREFRTINAPLQSRGGTSESSAASYPGRKTPNRWDVDHLPVS